MGAVHVEPASPWVPRASVGVLWGPSGTIPDEASSIDASCPPDVGSYRSKSKEQATSGHEKPIPPATIRVNALRLLIGLLGS